MGSKPAHHFESTPAANQPRVGLALQGGGNHGAFTWGVLRSLLPALEQRGIPVDGIVGASAGAKNAVYAGYGMAIAKAGHKAELADHMMEKLWFTVGVLAIPVRAYTSARKLSSPSTVVPEMWRNVAVMTGHVLDTMSAVTGVFNSMGSASQARQIEAFAKIPAVDYLRMMTQHGPVSLPTMSEHPLQHLVDHHIDFNKLAAAAAPKVLVNTTNLQTGGLNVYTGRALTSEAVASSGTLPELFNALKIGDSKHWDGGFSANPPLQPLYDECKKMTDLILVRVTPHNMRAGGMPAEGDHEAMADRRMEVMLNAAVEAELRLLPRLAAAEGRALNVHVISVPSAWPYSMRSKTEFESTNWQFFGRLRDAGVKAGDDWLKEHAEDIGQRSTYNHDYRVYGGRSGVKPVPA